MQLSVSGERSNECSASFFFVLSSKNTEEVTAMLERLFGQISKELIFSSPHQTVGVESEEDSGDGDE